MKRVWGLAVGWSAWCWGLAAATLLLALSYYSAASDGGIRVTAGSVVAAVVLVGLAGWGLAALYTRPPRSPKPALSNVMGVASWFVIVGVLRAAYVHAFGTAEWLGQAERYLLVAPLAALLLGFARRVGLGKWSTRVAIVILAIGFVGQGDEPSTPNMPTQAIANAADLNAAQRSGRPLLVQRSGVGVDSGSGARCQVGRADQMRRTLLGLPGRALRVRVWVCWDARGRPASVDVEGGADRHDSHQSIGSILLFATDPFALGPISGAPDSERPLDLGRHGDVDGSMPALARVSSTGRRVSVLLAWELRDPLARPATDPGFYFDDLPTGGSSRYRHLGPTSPLGTMYDVVTLDFDRDDGPDGTIMRVTPASVVPLAGWGGVAAAVKRAGAMPSVTLRSTH